MSKSGVSNPVPKDTKTVNDIFSSQDSAAYKQSKPLEVKRLSTNKSRGDDLNSSGYGAYKDNALNSDLDAQSHKRKGTKSMSKKRTTTSVRRNNPRSVAMASNYGSISVRNDFDVNTVNMGMDEIDIMLDELENQIPDEVYEDDDFDVDGMVKANRLLRDKIHEISQMVVTAIQKALKLKKQIVTHRDPAPSDHVQSKLDEIKSYQVKIMK